MKLDFYRKNSKLYSKLLITRKKEIDWMSQEDLDV